MTAQFTLSSDGPIAIDDVALLRDTGQLWRVALNQTTPVNKQPANQRGLRTEGGSLRRSWRFRELTADMTVEATNKKRYARIQDEGGIIPALDLRAAGRKRTARYNEDTGKESGRRSTFGTTGGSNVFLAFMGGGWRFFTKRGPIVIKPQHFVDASIELVMRGIGFRWKKGPTVTMTKGRAA